MAHSCAGSFSWWWSSCWHSTEQVQSILWLVAENVYLYLLVNPWAMLAPLCLTGPHPNHLPKTPPLITTMGLIFHPLNNSKWMVNSNTNFGGDKTYPNHSSTFYWHYLQSCKSDRFWDIVVGYPPLQCGDWKMLLSHVLCTESFHFFLQKKCRYMLRRRHRNSVFLFCSVHLLSL